MPEDYKTNTNFSQSSPGENGSVDPIRQSVTDKSAAFINKGLEEFQRPSFGTEILTGNSTEMILKYLNENYKSFSTNQDCSYTSMNIKDTQHFVKNLDEAYAEMSNGCTDVESLNTTLADFLTGNQLAVLPSRKMLSYYKLKNSITNGMFVVSGFTSAAISKTLPVASRRSHLLKGRNIVGTSFILGTAFSLLEDLLPWRTSRIAFNGLKWVALLPAKGAEMVINKALAPFEILTCGITLPSNGTKALLHGPGLTINDISRAEVKNALNIALNKLRETEISGLSGK